jgi:D-lactate dehydrogenase (cytochrome)
MSNGNAFEQISPLYGDFLHDESRKTGTADSISFPTSEADVREQLAAANARQLPVTIQGGRTGITAGAVPEGGHVLNLSRMNHITGLRYDPVADRFYVSVQPGVVLADLRAAIAKREFNTAGWHPGSLEALTNLRARQPFFFPPDPTESTATVGGMIACNASGACTFKYGPTRKHIEALRVVFVDGSTVMLRRGNQQALERNFSLLCDNGRKIEGSLPSYRLPPVKNAAGYFVEDDMDLVDLIIGSEGTLGVVVEAELALQRAPEFEWGVMAFFKTESDALIFVRLVRGDVVELQAPVIRVRPAAVEFFDSRALNLLRDKLDEYDILADIPDLPPEFHTGVYVEFHGDSEDELAEAVTTLSELMVKCGGDENATWTAMDSREMKRLHDFRHAVPETVNLVIDERRKKEPRLTKLGTDMAVSDSDLEKVMTLYHSALAATPLQYVVFGHIGNNHVHVNVLPATLEEYELGKELYLGWAREVIHHMGGSVSAEHGIGKLKVALLAEMYGEMGITQMRAVKHAFDPEFRLNRGNLFGAAQ